MLDRLGLVGRLVLILLLVLVPLGIVGVGFTIASRSFETGRGPRLPLPDQAAAIADALDGAQGERRELILRAVNSHDLRVRVVAARPPKPETSRSFPVMEWLVGQYLETYKSREVEILVLSPPDSTPMGRLFDVVSPISVAPLQIAMSLASGEHLLIETRGGVTQRLLGLPVGFWIGTLGTFLAGLAVLAIFRETRPITQLSETVALFSGEATPMPVPVRGAPDVQRLIGAVNDMQERIAALVRGRTVLLGAVSHDLKTYITRLRLRVEDIADDDARDRAVADLNLMTALIDDAIAVARNATVSGRMEKVDLAELLRAELAERDPGTTGLILGAGGHVVEADRVGLQRLFANLIDNALSFAPRCEVSTHVHDGSLTVLVDDNGPGIAAADRTAVFEPFVRLEPSRSRATGGTGLGLAIVKQIVDAHGGFVGVESAPAGGTRIRVTLPERQRNAAASVPK